MSDYKSDFLKLASIDDAACAAKPEALRGATANGFTQSRMTSAPTAPMLERLAYLEQRVTELERNVAQQHEMVTAALREIVSVLGLK